jgi:hypothetical protein
MVEIFREAACIGFPGRGLEYTLGIPLAVKLSTSIPFGAKYSPEREPGER